MSVKKTKTAEDFIKELQDKASGSYVLPTAIPPIYYEEWDRTTRELRKKMRTVNNEDIEDDGKYHTSFYRTSSGSLMYTA